MTGVGRIIRTAPGWLAAATDRQIVLCDLKRNTYRRLDVSLVQLTHLAIKPDEFGLALIQERDRIGRLTPAGRWVWKHELRSTVEELAIGPRGFAAVTTNSGQLLIFDPTGESTAGFTFDAERPAPLDRGARRISRRRDLVEPGQAIAVAARARSSRQRFMGAYPSRGKDGRLLRLGKIALVTAADGRALTLRRLWIFPRRKEARPATPTTCSASTRLASRCGSHGGACISSARP